ncbi:MAG: hypothetical protein Q8L90_05675 [Bacteroidota bacterium]|jgi:hypothetical protein|nr:hypothetical protein [Bacteroidota bacterium]
MKAEPRTILRFLLEYFDIINELYETQSKGGVIPYETLNLITSKHNTDIKSQLIDYKILSSVNDNYEIRTVYYNLIEFILSEFKPLLPETIEKYHVSISELFRKIKENINGDKVILNQRLTELANEIRTFYEMVEKNTISLLNETRELKANVKKIDYREKIVRASRWIDEYIIPLNKILDINHSASIANKLYDISEYSNKYRLNCDDESTRVLFEKLYFQLIQVNDNLLRQSKILTTELLPLIERIRTESIILTGWITFLKNPYKQKVPQMFESKRTNIYSNNTFFNASEIFEQFKNETDIYFEDEINTEEKWIFDKEFFTNKLKSNLPVNDFFKWCNKTLKEEYKKVEIEKFFALTTLAFDEDIERDFGKTPEFDKIKINDLTLTVPKITINKHGIS